MLVNSIILAKFLGLFYFLLGIGVAINPKHAAMAAKNIAYNNALQFMASLIPLMLGSFLVVIHNAWVWRWEVIITTMAWLMLFAGIFRLCCVSTWVKMIISSSQKESSFRITGIVTSIIGLVLLYFGFYG